MIVYAACKKVFQQNGILSFKIDDITVKLYEGMGLDFMTQDLLKDTVYTYNGHKVIIGKVGESNSWCTSENIIHAGSYYKNSVLRLQWSLEVSVETAFYDINDKVIHIPQTVSLKPNGLTYSTDLLLGTYTYDDIIYDCKEELTTFIDGSIY